MFSQLPTTSLSVADLMSGAFRFAVPPYQRAYSWTRDEALQLLDDLQGAAGIADSAAGESDYFLGTILLLDRSGRGRWPSEGARQADETVVDIVDGQQRLVTLSILAAALRNLDDSEQGQLWSRLNALLALPGSAADGPRRFRLMLTGRDQRFIERYVLSPGAGMKMPAHDFEEGAGARALLDVREQFLEVLGTQTAEERQALASYLCDRTHVVAILTTDIDRAHRVFMVLNDRGRPLLRSDILKAEVLSTLAPDRTAVVLEAWDGAAHMLGNGFDRFFAHLRAIHGVVRPQVITAVRSLIAESGGTEPFVLRTLAPCARVYRRILDAASGKSGLPEPIENALVYLGRLNGEEWVPSAILALRRFEEGDPAAPALVAEIDRQAHLMRLLTLGGDKRARRFVEIAAAIRGGAVATDDVAAFRWTRDDLKPAFFNLQMLWRRNPSFCKLLLLRVSDAIAGSLTRVDPAAFSIEHVLPQRPPPASAWRQLFPVTEEREALTQSLGNLVLVSHRLNDAARNRDFAEKRVVLGRRQEGIPHLALLDDLLAAKSWGPDEIRVREARILEIVARLLRIDIRPAAWLR